MNTYLYKGNVVEMIGTKKYQTLSTNNRIVYETKRDLSIQIELVFGLLEIGAWYQVKNKKYQIVEVLAYKKKTIVAIVSSQSGTKKMIIREKPILVEEPFKNVQEGENVLIAQNRNKTERTLENGPYTSKVEGHIVISVKLVLKRLENKCVCVCETPGSNIEFIFVFTKKTVFVTQSSDPRCTTCFKYNPSVTRNVVKATMLKTGKYQTLASTIGAHPALFDETNKLKQQFGDKLTLKVGLFQQVCRTSDSDKCVYILSE